MNELPQASGLRSVAVGRDVIRSIISTGDHARIFVGDYERLSDAYIEPWPVFERVQLDHFAGREWLVAEVDAFLREHDRGYFVLEAGAGLGKTTFLAWLTRERGFIHHFAELAPGINGTGRALKSIAAQLVLAYHLQAYEAEGFLPGSAADPNYLLKLLKQTADQLAEDEKIVLVIDALDEVGSVFSENVLGLPRVLPKGVYIIASQRPVPVTLYVDTATTPRRSFRLIAESDRNQQDMRLFLEEAAHWPGIVRALQQCGESEQRFVSVLLEKCRGIWIYLHYVIHEIEQGERSPLYLDALPDGMTQYYARYWQQWRNGDEDAWYASYLPLLAMLAVAQQAPTLDYLLTWTGITLPSQRLRRLFQERWRPFLALLEESQQIRYRFYHATLQEFFSGQVNREQLTDAEMAFVDELIEATREAHHRLANYYLTKWGGMESRLPGLASAARESEEGYGLRYLGLHLEAAGRTQELHQLLALETEQHSNIWYAVKEQSDDIFGFVTDVTRAWNVAEGALKASPNKAGEPLGLQLRYALIVTSLRSLAQNIRPSLLVALVEKKIWTRPQALAYALQISDSYTRAQTLEALLPLLPLPLLRQLLATIDLTEESFNISSYSPEQRVGLLKALVPRLAEAGDIPTALAAIHALPTPLPHFYRIEHISMRLDVARFASDGARERIIEDALGAATAVEQPTDRASALMQVLHHVPALSQVELIQKILTTLQTSNRSNSWYDPVESESDVLIKLGSYFERLPERVIRSALSTIRVIRDDQTRLRVLIQWLPLLPPRLRQSAKNKMFEAMGRISPREQLGGVQEILPYLPASLQAKVVRATLEVVRAIWNEVQQGKSSRASTGWGDEIGTDEMWDARTVALALVSFLPYLEGSEREDALQLALSATRRVIREEKKVTSDQDGAPSFIQEREQRSIWAGAVMLDVLACFPEPQRSQLYQELLTEIQSFKGLWGRALALSGLLSVLAPPQYDEVAQKALSAIRRTRGPESQLQLLEGFIPAVAGSSVLDEALQFALEAMWKTAVSSGERRRFFLKIVDLLPLATRGVQVQQLWEEIRLHEKGEERTNSLASLAPYADAVLLNEMLPYARLVEDDTDRLQAQVALSASASRAQQEEILAAVKAIENVDQRARRLAQMTPSLPAELRRGALIDALAAMKNMQDVYERDRLLRSFVSECRDGGCLDEIVDMLLEITPDSSQADLLGVVANRLVAIAPEKVVVFLQRYPVEWNARIWAILDLPEELRPPDWIERIADLSVLKWILPSRKPTFSLASLREIDRRIGSFESSRDQIQAMIALLPFYPSDEREKEQQRLLQAIRDSAGNEAREFIIALAPHVSGQHLQILYKMVRSLKSQQNRMEALLGIVAFLPKQQRELELQDILTKLGGKGENDQRALRIYLKKAAPALTSTTIQRAVSLAHTIKDQFEEGEVLISLILRLTDLRLFEEAMKEVQTLSWVSPSAYAYEDEIPKYAGYFQLAIKLAEMDEPDLALQLLRSLDERSNTRNDLAIRLAEILARSGHIEKAWDTVWLYHQEKQPAPVLAQITPFLLRQEPATFFPLFHKTLKRSIILPRQGLLATIGALAPVIAVLGGPDAVQATLQAIRDVGHWWP